MKRVILFCGLLGLFGAGCFPTLTVPTIAEPLVPAQEAGNVVDNANGFGQLPPLPQAPSAGRGIISINAEIPTLQKQVSVIRMQAGALSANQLQNLTTSFNLPIGIVGEPTVQKFDLTWTNNENIAWTYSGSDKKIKFKDASQGLPKTYAKIWPENTRPVQAARDFLVFHGFSDKNLQNLDIQVDWKIWKENLAKNNNCMDQQSSAYITGYNQDPEQMSAPALVYNNTSCADPAYPTLIPITFERIVDQRNVLQQNGAPELGGKLFYDTYTDKIYSGWILIQSDPQRSDYPAITEQEMRSYLENGGISGLPQGNADIQKTSFAFYRFPTAPYQAEIMVPALVGDGYQTVNSQQIPFRVVVPLTKDAD